MTVAPNPSDSLPDYCPQCDGTGEVFFNTSRNNDPQCDDSARCPSCEGDGFLTPGKPVFYFEHPS